MKLTRAQLLAYFETVLPFCNKRKVAELLQKCNVNTEVTPINCLSAYENSFTLFAPSFGLIAKTALQSDKCKTYMKAIQGELKAGQYSPLKANGLKDNASKFVISGAGEKMTADQKFQIGMGIISAITDSISTGRDWINKSSLEAKAEADRIKAAGDLEEKKALSTKAWVWPVTIATIALFAMVIFVIVRKNR